MEEAGLSAEKPPMGIGEGEDEAEATGDIRSTTGDGDLFEACDCRGEDRGLHTPDASEGLMAAGWMEEENGSSAEEAGAAATDSISPENGVTGGQREDV